MHLTLQFWVDLKIGAQRFPLRALVDTGAEVNVIRMGALPLWCIKPNEKPIKMSGADASALEGGQLGVTGELCLGGWEQDTKEWVELQCPAHFYVANIAQAWLLTLALSAGQTCSTGYQP